MKSLAFTVWLFINLLCFSMCGYLYLIWSKYWIQIESEKYISQKPTRREYPKSPEIVYYGLNLTAIKLKNKSIERNLNDVNKNSPNVINKNYVFNFDKTDLNNNKYNEVENEKFLNNYKKDMEKYSFPKIKQNIIKSVVTRESGNVKTQFLDNKNSAQPRFNLETPFIEFDTLKYKCVESYPSDSCMVRTSKFKNLLFQEFDRRMRNDEKQAKLNNRYNVTYDFKPVPKGEGFGKFNSKNRDSVLCELKRINIKTIESSDEPFSTFSFGSKIPKLPLLKFKHFNTCAIVTSAGALYDSNLGSFIDGHELVMRFNHAPTKGYEKDLGSKTTIRIVNSKVMTDKAYRFQTADLFRNISILGWDPSDYSSDLQNWYKKPDFDLFSQYKRFMRRNPHADFHLLNPKTLWDLWDFLQNNTPFRILRNPPSSGFLGFAVLLQYCSSISVLEYLPSVRVSKRCHYYGPETDTACTFGAWHPLAAEKMAVWKMSESKDFETFQKGILTVRSNAVCSTSREL